MFPRKVCFALLPAILIATGLRASAQAHVTENQNTYIYVDANSGNDGNSGAQNSPYRTLQAAVNRSNAYNQKWVGTKIIVNPGVYRESVYIGNYGATSAPVTIQAAVAGTAILAGSDVLSGWSQVSANIYWHSWTPNLGTCPIPSGWPSPIATIARRTEMLFVNGVPLTEVMSFSDLRPGTFWVDEASNSMDMYPPSYTDVWTATIEAAVRSQTLSVQGRTNMVFRGLVFRHGASCMNLDSAQVSGSTNILFDSIQANWNNWGGLGIYGSNDVTVQNSVANYNGGVGLHGYEDQYALYSYNQTDYNNWRGAQGALYDWASGGTKLMLMRNTTVQGHFSYRNQAQGLWFDTDNKNITISNATLSENLLASLQLEANEGPITLENSHLCSSGLGVKLINSESVSIWGNTFYNNSGTNIQQAEIYLAGQSGGRYVTDWLTHQGYELYTSGTGLWNNTFENAASGQNVFGTYLAGNDWSEFANTLNASGNKWYDPTTSVSYKLPNNDMTTLSGWKNATGTDWDSVWATPATSPAAACWVSAPSYSDFNVSLTNESLSMTKGWASTTVRVNSYGYGAVSLWVEGLPSGVWATLSQSSIVSGSVNLQLHATTWAGYQQVPVTLWAMSGSRVHTTTLYVNVTPA